MNQRRRLNPNAILRTRRASYCGKQRNTYGINESTGVQKDGVEGDHAHALEGIAVDDEGRYDCVACLESEGD
jgi:hypothetical protein